MDKDEIKIAISDLNVKLDTIIRRQDDVGVVVEKLPAKIKLELLQSLVIEIRNTIRSEIEKKYV